MKTSSKALLCLFIVMLVSLQLANCGTQELNLKKIAMKASMQDSGFLRSRSARSQTASKGVLAIEDIAIMNQDDYHYSTIFSKSLKTSNRALLIDISFECGAMIKTSRKDNSAASPLGSAAVRVRVLIDGKVLAPGDLSFCRSSQELTANFGGILETCADTNADATLFASECDFSDKELASLLSTMNTARFNFATEILTSGVHTIEVQAKIFSSSHAEAGSSEVRGFIGKGTVLASTQRLAR